MVAFVPGTLFQGLFQQPHVQTENFMRGHWIKMLGAVIALLPLAGYAGQGLEGGWQGTLDVGLVKFRVALEIQKDGQGQYWAFFNNIDDGIYHAKVSPLSIKGSSFHGQCPAGEVLDLKLNGNHDRLEGSYRQAGGSFQKPGKVSHLALGRGMDYLVPRLDVKGKPVRKFAYHIPEAGSDGWETGDLWNSVADIGAIETGIRKILNGTYPRIHGLCVVHQGKLILDEYFYGYGPDTPHPVQSITKSVFSLLFGIAVDQGRLKPEDKLYDFFPEYRKKPGWEDGKDKITLQTLLTMTSGLGCDDLKDSKSCSWGMVDSPDWLNFTLSLPLSQEPGKRFAYCGACLTPLSAVLAKKSGMQPAGIRREIPVGTLGDQASFLGPGAPGHHAGFLRPGTAAPGPGQDRVFGIKRGGMERSPGCFGKMGPDDDRHSNPKGPDQRQGRLWFLVVAKPCPGEGKRH